MGGWDLAIVGAALMGYAVVSKRLNGTVLTAAMLFFAVGYVLGSEGFDVFDTEIGSGGVRSLAEVTLALVLFSDAATLDTRRLQRESSIPLRLLGIGLPLTIVAGTLVALPLFPQLALLEAVVLAVLLAPTDAALGQAVVSDQRLPSRLRQGLNVESGLNDGICVPLLFAALAMAELDKGESFEGGVLVDLVKEVFVASGVGVAVAVITVLLATFSLRRGWIEEHWVPILPAAAVAVAYVATAELGGSGFIACFVAGLVYGRLFGDRAARSLLLVEELGAVLSAATFLVFGAVVIGPAINDFDAATVVYAVLSLTLVRMVPVAMAFVGSKARLPTVAFAGWFGPRGLASIVFMLTVLQEWGLDDTRLIVQVTSFTVLLSVVAHGMTASPLTNLYVRWFTAHTPAPVLEAQIRETDRQTPWRIG